jgi:hypothetical protein
MPSVFLKKTFYNFSVIMSFGLYVRNLKYNIKIFNYDFHLNKM